MEMNFLFTLLDCSICFLPEDSDVIQSNNTKKKRVNNDLKRLFSFLLGSFMCLFFSFVFFVGAQKKDK
jgi:hypothetical protein